MLRSAEIKIMDVTSVQIAGNWTNMTGECGFFFFFFFFFFLTGECGLVCLFVFLFVFFNR